MKIIKALILGLITMTSCAQDQNLAQRLGYPKDTKMLIMHADDIGVAYSVNRATIKAFEETGISSASIMVPCPWFKDIATYINKNPKWDFGLHLTLTAEWENYKWGGVAPQNEISSLLNQEGYFYASVEEVVANALPEEVEKEIRAQVQRALDFGIDVTHLDSHMGTLFYHPEYFKSYQAVGKEFGIPVFLPVNMLAETPIIELVDPWFIPIEKTFMASPEVSPDNWDSFYAEIIENLEPGLNEIIIHVGYDDAELQGITVNHPDFGSAWRQRDLDYVLSDEFKSMLQTQEVELVTYRQIRDLMNQ